MQKLVNYGLSLIALVLGVVGVIIFWHQCRGVADFALDLNLLVVRSFCGLVPAYYGEMAESILRELSADRALLFFEANIAAYATIRLFFWVL